MLSIAEEIAIEEEVEKLMSNDTMFTLFDVTMILQKEHGFTYRHNEIKEEISNMVLKLMDTTYDYACHTLKLARQIYAKVFHPLGFDYKKYVSKWIKNKTSKTNDNTVKNNNTKSMVKTDKRGRICVPCEYIRQIKQNNEVVVYVDGDRLVIDKLSSSSVNGCSNTKKVYKVDCYDNIRIPHRTLKQISDDAVSYSIALDGDHVVITTG